MNSYPRESVELVPLTVTVDGVAVTDYSVALVMDGERPTAWTAAVALDGETGVMLDGTATAPALLHIFVKVSDTPEVPVIDLGTIALT